MDGRKAGAETERSDRDPEAPPVPKSVPEAPRPAGGKAEDQREIGGPKGPEPTRYGDWEKGGRCSDF